MTKTTIFFFALLGVTTIRVAAYAQHFDQSEGSSLNEQPLGEDFDDAGKRRVDTPEVVLQLKYDGGALNKIYLAQFRKGPSSGTPSVFTRTSHCSDLCYAGLGGDICGNPCHDMIPVGLKSALLETSSNSSSEEYGQPRIHVCPNLCANKLGEPLCNCGQLAVAVSDNVDWASICRTFCEADGYVLGGCPPCDESLPSNELQSKTAASTRILNTVKGWTAWCNVQCHQGQGGAACNCDRAPLI